MAARECQARMGGIVRVAIGEISAACNKCSGEQFEAVPMSGRLLRERLYRCAGCKSEFQYGELLLQIGERTILKVKTGRETRKPALAETGAIEEFKPPVAPGN